MKKFKIILMLVMLMGLCQAVTRVEASENYPFHQELEERVYLTFGTRNDSVFEAEFAELGQICYPSYCSNTQKKVHVEGYISNISDIDYYGFTIDHISDVVIDLTSIPTNANYSITLYSEDYSDRTTDVNIYNPVFVSFSNKSGNQSEVLYEHLNPGLYFVEIRSVQGYSNSDSYDLVIMQTQDNSDLLINMKDEKGYTGCNPFYENDDLCHVSSYPSDIDGIYFHHDNSDLFNKRFVNGFYTTEMQEFYEELYGNYVSDQLYIYNVETVAAFYTVAKHFQKEVEEALHQQLQRLEIIGFSVDVGNEVISMILTVSGATHGTIISKVIEITSNELLDCYADITLSANYDTSTLEGMTLSEKISLITASTLPPSLLFDEIINGFGDIEYRIKEEYFHAEIFDLIISYLSSDSLSTSADELALILPALKLSLNAFEINDMLEVRVEKSLSNLSRGIYSENYDATISVNFINSSHEDPSFFIYDTNQYFYKMEIDRLERDDNTPPVLYSLTMEIESNSNSTFTFKQKAANYDFYDFMDEFGLLITDNNSIYDDEITINGSMLTADYSTVGSSSKYIILTDKSGNSNIYYFTINIEDGESPTISKERQTIYKNTFSGSWSSYDIISKYGITATDNVDESPTIIINTRLVKWNIPGTYRITVTARDDSSNSSTTYVYVKINGFIPIIELM